MVYIVAIPEPGEKTTSHPISSPGLHLTIGAFQRLNPQGVLPVVIAVPLGVTMALLVLVRLGSGGSAGRESDGNGDEAAAA